MAVTPRRSSPGLSAVHPIFLFLFALALLATTVRSEQEHTQKPIVSEDVRQNPSLPVLGYVTPWNSRGKQLVEDHRQKFDIISPVWYTIHAVGDGYEVRGAPPGPEDDEWYKRLQHPAASADGAEQKPLQVAPRFIVDGWTEEDYRQFIFNDTRWQMLSDAVMGVVTEMAFDGVVFESGATHALPQSLTRLSEALHGAHKILIVVMQPIRTAGEKVDELSVKRAELIETTNSLILQNLPQLSLVVDYFSIMTYDMSGPGGREINARNIGGEGKLAEAAAKGNVREPGPNTSADWVRQNLLSFIEATDAGSANHQGFQASLELQQASRKFLMGAPLYGYRYPVMFVNKNSGHFVEPTPAEKLPDKPLITGSAGPKVRKKLPEDSVAILIRGGEAITASEIVDLIKENKPEALRLEPEGEYYFDYEEKPGTGFYRVFLPTKESLGHVLKTIKDVTEDDLISPFGGAGVALWEVGQSSAGLLAAL